MRAPHSLAMRGHAAGGVLVRHLQHGDLAHLTTAPVRRKLPFGQAAPPGQLARRNKYTPTVTPLTTVSSPETKTFLVLVSPVTM